MKICIITNNLKYSGAQKIICMLMEKLNERGHDVSVILLTCDKKYDGFDYLTQYPVAIKGHKIKNILKRYESIRKITKENKFDAVVSFGVPNNIDALTALLFCKENLICCDRNDPVYNPKRGINRIRRKMLYPFSKGFVFQTEEIKNYFSDKIQKRSYVVPNFIESDYECVTYNKRRKVVATTARLDNFQKNHIMMINGFAKFFETHKDYTLEIYGDGPDKEMYEKLIAELGMNGKIKLMGRVENVSEKLKDVEIFALTSKFEGMPNALMEAMATGLPCVSTDCGGGGARFLITDNENGILIPQNDENAFCKALTKLADDEELRINLGKKAYEVNKKLEINKIVDLWEDAIKKVGGKQ